MSATFLTSYRDLQVVTIAQVEEASLAEIRELNRQAIGSKHPRIPEIPMGFNALRWSAFKSLMKPGDGLRWRMVTKGPRHMRAGFQITRPPNLVVASFVVAMS